MNNGIFELYAASLATKRFSTQKVMCFVVIFFSPTMLAHALYDDRENASEVLM